MPEVKVRCKEGRLVAFDRYVAGREYVMDAERAGKYFDYFSPIGRDDDEAVAKAWGARKAEIAREQEYRAQKNDIATALGVLERAGILSATDAMQKLGAKGSSA